MWCDQPQSRGLCAEAGGACCLWGGVSSCAPSVQGLGTHRLGMIDYMAPEMLLMLTESEKSNGMYVNDRIQGYDEKVDVWQVRRDGLTGAPCASRVCPGRALGTHLLHLAAPACRWGSSCTSC